VTKKKRKKIICKIILFNNFELNRILLFNWLTWENLQNINKIERKRNAYHRCVAEFPRKILGHALRKCPRILYKISNTSLRPLGNRHAPNIYSDASELLFPSKPWLLWEWRSGSCTSSYIFQYPLLIIPSIYTPLRDIEKPDSVRTPLANKHYGIAPEKSAERANPLFSLSLYFSKSLP